METILSAEMGRAGMAVDVLTKWLHKPRAIAPLTMLLGRKDDPYPLVLAARGLGWLGNPHAVPALAEMLLDENKPFVARITAAEALGSLGVESACRALDQATASPRLSVAKASARALEHIQMEEKNERRLWRRLRTGFSCDFPGIQFVRQVFSHDFPQHTI